MPHAHGDRDLAKRADATTAEVGTRIHQARLERGMTLTELAGEDISRSVLSLVERGKSRLSARALWIIAERLERPISWFFADDVGSRRLTAEYAVSQAEIALRQSCTDDAFQVLDGVDVPADLRARVLWLRGRAALATSQFKQATSALQQAISALEGRDDPRLATDIYDGLARALYEERRYGEAEDACEAGVSLAWREGDRHMTARFRLMLGHILFVRNDFDGARNQYRTARDLLDAPCALDDVAAARGKMSAARWRAGERTEAVSCAQHALGMYQARDRQRAHAAQLADLAARYEALGHYPEAQALAERAARCGEALGSTSIQAAARTTLAAILFRLNRIDEAHREAIIAEHLAGDEAEGMRASAWTVQARIAEQRKDHERADALFQRALQVFDRLHQHARYTDAACAYGDILQARGDARSALKWMNSARAHTPRHPVSPLD